MNKICNITIPLGRVDQLQKEMVKLPSHNLFWLMVDLFGVFRLRRQIFKEIKKFKSCNYDCQDVRCLHIFLDKIREIRDLFKNILLKFEGSSNRFPFKAVRKFLQREYELWDQEVEDLTIYSEPELRDLIKSIYAKI